MKEEIRPINNEKYGWTGKSVIALPEKPKIVKGIKTTTTGHLWWKKVNTEDIWVAVYPFLRTSPIENLRHPPVKEYKWEVISCSEDKDKLEEWVKEYIK